MTRIPEKTIAWLMEPGEGGSLQELIELMAQVSRMAAAVENADASDYEGCRSLFDECLKLEKKHMDLLNLIGHNMDRELPTYTRGELKTAVPATDDLFGPAFRFSSVDQANVHIFLWLSLPFLYPLIHQCQVLTLSDTPDCLRIEGYLAKEAAYHLSTFYVGQAARCLPYLGQSGMHSWSLFYGILFAIQAARVYSHVRDWERFLWAQDIFTCLELSGFGYATRFREIWWNYWFDTHRHNLFRLVDYKELTKEDQPTLSIDYN
ncbi:hypothetical protein NUU61_000562 [Penicillium alfredii]|uniref:Uncharacterized protein n=1 Tax=Penicillium alfredii TaxID=1506179 RepID=A0A9W9G9X6_9EURO|nr:uncharacterized protein NUU61_000562 [Penicillium alfredii]KAJ5114803.1 hypothetical protein NUU61_000562 [Penicillium alfredii]